MLGGLLAGLMFRLSAAISGADLASAAATLLVAFSLPLLAYPYLVYPEMPAALLITLVVTLLITRPQPTPMVLLAVLTALMVLPWLNRRFIPLALVLAPAAFWLWRRDASRRGPAALLLVGVSVGGILWYNSTLIAPPQPDFNTAPTGTDFWLRLVRGVGWLVDQQRGLFVFAPLFVAALWGLPAFIRHARHSCRRCWLALLPFGLSLATVTLAGGFWIAWELGPRFLVVGLPGLAPLLALAFRDVGRSVIGLGLLLLLAGVSLFNSWVVLKNPELPYKSSLPIFYEQALGLPFTEMLPDMANYWRISPADDVPAWTATAGQPQPLVESGPLSALPFGHYRLSIPLQAPATLPPDTELLRLSIKTLGGGQVLNRVITAAMVPPDGAALSLSFLNPHPDRWRTPMLLYLSATGESEVSVGSILLSPDPWSAFWLPYLYLALITGSVVLVGFKVAPRSGKSLPRPGRWGWAVLMVLLLGAGGFLWWRQAQPVRAYDAASMPHFTGRAVTDPAAVDGQAWQVDPAIDPPQKAIYGPFEFFDAGDYRVTFRLMLPQAVDTAQDIAWLQVNATANFEKLLTQPIRAEHFSQPNLYHDMVLTVSNPRRQALSFEVHYLGLAPLLIDGVTVERIVNDE